MPKTVKQIVCENKVAHASRARAAAALRRQFRRLDDAGRDRPPLKVYHCRECGRWHVGSSDAGAARMPVPYRRGRFRCVAAPVERGDGT